MNHEIKPVATFNDLVNVAGYGNHLFAVEAYYYEYYYEPDAELTEVVYDLTCVYGDSGYIIGDQSDVTLACKAGKADVFLQAYKPAPSAEVMPSWMRGINFAIGNGGIDMAKPTKVAKVKVPTKRQRIDALLDERNDVGSTDGFVPTQDAEYKQRRHDEIDAKLKELTAG
ncbi:hypothetical protein [Sporosarcina psychrophila]|uniref:Uncharacterized protein n=1 Tax=Sporosarcina psychrophila TaxID=1476 RepID=A0ABV2KBK3_SPOPS